MVVPYFIAMVFWGLVSLSYFLEFGIYFKYFSLIFAVGFMGAITPAFWNWISYEITKENNFALGVSFIGAVAVSANIWAPIMTTSIFNMSNSYVYVIITIIGFGVFGLSGAIVFAVISNWLSYKRNEYTVITEPDEVSMKSNFK